MHDCGTMRLALRPPTCAASVALHRAGHARARARRRSSRQRR